MMRLLGVGPIDIIPTTIMTIPSKFAVHLFEEKIFRIFFTQKKEFYYKVNTNRIIFVSPRNLLENRTTDVRAGHTMKRKGEKLPYLKTAGLTLRETSHPGSVPSSD